MRDALVTIGTRFGLAVLIFATDIALARLLGPTAKGRFALVLLYSQLAALIVGWGTDQALAVVSGRDRETARHGFANALIWTAVVGGAAVLVSVWLFGAPSDGPATGPLASLIPNLSGTQFMFAAVAVPAELFFGLGLFALLGRKRVVPYNLIRVIRRAVLLLMIVAAAARAQPRRAGDHRRSDPLGRLAGWDRRRTTIEHAPSRGTPVWHPGITRFPRGATPVQGGFVPDQHHPRRPRDRDLLGHERLGRDAVVCAECARHRDVQPRR
jgi:multisubunit Na+/H+ antiporter MnhC subunit